MPQHEENVFKIVFFRGLLTVNESMSYRSRFFNY